MNLWSIEIKMENEINKSMLGDLLPQKQEEKKKFTSTQNSTYDWYSNGGDRISDIFSDDDGPDPLDKDYGSTTRNRSSQNNDYVRKTYTTPYVASNLNKTISDDTPIQSALDRGVYHGKELVLDKEGKETIVDEIMKIVGKALEENKLIWSTNGSKYIRAALGDIVNGELYHESWKIEVHEDTE